MVSEFLVRGYGIREIFQSYVAEPCTNIELRALSESVRHRPVTCGYNVSFARAARAAQSNFRLHHDTMSSLSSSMVPGVYTRTILSRIPRFLSLSSPSPFLSISKTLSSYVSLIIASETFLTLGFCLSC